MEVTAAGGYTVTARINPGPQGVRSEADVTAPASLHFTFDRMER